MKKTFLFLIILGLSLMAKSQNISVEKSIFGVQAGILGIWVNNESRLSDQVALRSEIGLNTYVWQSDYYKDTGLVLLPEISVEPRWYYNLDKRQKNSKSTEGNSGDFVTLKTTYIPDWFAISGEKDLKVVSEISFVPTWGIRRNLGNNFNFEAGIGVGYKHIFAKSAGFAKDKGEVAYNGHLRIGYKF